MRIYIDTSVIGGYYDKEFSEATQEFFAHIEKGQITIVISELLEAELLRAPNQIRNHLRKYPAMNIEKIEFTRESAELANKYVAAQVVGKTSIADCQHIAIATINKVDALVSWNFKHIVNLNRIKGYNTVNLELGYSILEIRTPKEILNDENSKT